MQKRALWVVIVVVLLVAGAVLRVRLQPEGDEFDRLMTRGAGNLERSDAANAIAIYSQAVGLYPESVDARLNLANAYLLAGEDQKVIEQCQEALNLDHDSGAAYYLMGVAHLHLNQAEQAVQAFQQSQRIDPAVTALNFQLGLAQDRLGHVDEAIATFETMLQFDPEHASAHYQLSRLYQRVNRAEDAAREIQKHQEILARSPDRPAGSRPFEICKYTEPRMAFKLEQPDKRGISVRFVGATAEAFGQRAADFRAPMAVLDYNHDGRNSLFVMEGQNGFRLLDNQQGRFEPMGQVLPGKADANYRDCLVGDLNNDRFEDVVVLGEHASHAFRFATNGQAREFTMASGLQGVKGKSGGLADLDFTGRLDLLTVLPDGQGLRVFRNLGNFYFKEDTTNSGLPLVLPGAVQAAVEDWNSEDLPGVFVSRQNQPPVFFAKQRAGAFVQTNTPTDWPVGSVIATADLNNDLRPDLVVGGASEITIVFGGQAPRTRIPLSGQPPKAILLADYDNDGWVDVVGYGAELRIWRNLGKDGFSDETSRLGLDKAGAVDALVAGDFDNDADTDLIASAANGLRFWRNDGGNANKQLKLRLIGNRSNASGLGVRVDVMAGRWRTRRSLQRLPFEVGVGRYEKIDALKIHWFDLATTAVDVQIGAQAFPMVELTVPAGSCPYLYAWDGERFRFVTDMLGASPLGLPVAKGRYIEADPEEFLALGDDSRFPPKDGKYEVRITEELREVLYLDFAQLVVVDHPAGTVVHPTSKLRPGKPFPPHELWTLRPLTAPVRAMRSDERDVTEALAKTDNVMVSPVKLREPQLRGLAEPFSVTMDFGELRAERPLVLALTGWLRFGGGMANVAASMDKSLPFPFPTLEAELPDGSWKTVPTDVGAPAGKTKTILVDLENRLPAGVRRLRLTAAFEIHWDSVLLGEKVPNAERRQVTLLPDRAELGWHGFGDFEDLPAYLPLTPQYARTRDVPPWNRAVSGWCTRYGPVGELVRDRDDKLVLLNAGDELALSFPADRLPPKPGRSARSCFLFVVGWDKDADFHVGQGWRVEPLPFAGIDEQAYGRQGLPRSDSNWTRDYNRRWVGPLTLTKGFER
jgi:tetratricopeptide (TPR) repeat protein